MKDEGAVNDDFQRNGKLPTLERVIEATQGNVVLSFIPRRLPNTQHSKQTQRKLLPEEVDYVRTLVEHYKLDLGQLGLYHCCEECYQPGTDRHSHEQFLRHGSNGDQFRGELMATRILISDALGRKPVIFTSPQNWMHDQHGNINREALGYIADNFEILVLTHPGRVLGIPFYTLTRPGGILIGTHPEEINSSRSPNILPTVDLTREDQKAKEKYLDEARSIAKLQHINCEPSGIAGLALLLQMKKTIPKHKNILIVNTGKLKYP